MGTIGFWQVALIALVVILLFGAGKIPRLMKDMGAGIKSFKQGLQDSDDDDNKQKKSSLDHKNK